MLVSGAPKSMKFVSFFEVSGREISKCFVGC